MSINDKDSNAAVATPVEVPDREPKLVQSTLANEQDTPVTATSTEVNTTQSSATSAEQDSGWEELDLLASRIDVTLSALKEDLDQSGELKSALEEHFATALVSTQRLGMLLDELVSAPALNAADLNLYLDESGKLSSALNALTPLIKQSGLARHELEPYQDTLLEAARSINDIVLLELISDMESDKLEALKHDLHDGIISYFDRLVIDTNRINGGDLLKDSREELLLLEEELETALNADDPLDSFNNLELTDFPLITDENGVRLTSSDLYQQLKELAGGIGQAFTYEQEQIQNQFRALEAKLIAIDKELPASSAQLPVPEDRNSERARDEFLGTLHNGVRVRSGNRLRLSERQTNQVDKALAKLQGVAEAIRLKDPKASEAILSQGLGELKKDLLKAYGNMGKNLDVASVIEPTCKDLKETLYKKAGLIATKPQENVAETPENFSNVKQEAGISNKATETMARQEPKTASPFDFERFASLAFNAREYLEAIAERPERLNLARNLQHHFALAYSNASELANCTRPLPTPLLDQQVALVKALKSMHLAAESYKTFATSLKQAGEAIPDFLKEAISDVVALGEYTKEKLPRALARNERKKIIAVGLIGAKATLKKLPLTLAAKDTRRADDKVLQELNHRIEGALDRTFLAASGGLNLSALSTLDLSDFGSDSISGVNVQEAFELYKRSISNYNISDIARRLTDSATKSFLKMDLTPHPEAQREADLNGKALDVMLLKLDSIKTQTKRDEASFEQELIKLRELV